MKNRLLLDVAAQGPCTFKNLILSIVSKFLLTQYQVNFLKPKRESLKWDESIC